MIKEIVKYPQKPSKEFNAPVRFFNEELFALIQNLKDTIMDNELDGLSAYQIGSPYSVIVIRNEDGSFLEMINARIFQNKEKITTTEKTAYFPNCEAEVSRSKHIKVAYETSKQEQKYLDASDELAIIIQRKIDYNFGANFRVRLDDNQKDKLDMKLEHGIDVIVDSSCPTTFNRDKVLKLINVLLGFSLIGILASFFLSAELITTLNTIENYSLSLVFILIVFYFFYAQYEGKKYTNCMSCQIGNIIGTASFHLVKLLCVFILKYFLL